MGLSTIFVLVRSPEICISAPFNHCDLMLLLTIVLKKKYHSHTHSEEKEMVAEKKSYL
jgi:hypothetical protein